MSSSSSMVSLAKEEGKIEIKDEAPEIVRGISPHHSSSSRAASMSPIPAGASPSPPPPDMSSPSSQVPLNESNTVLPSQIQGTLIHHTPRTGLPIAPTGSIQVRASLDMRPGSNMVPVKLVTVSGEGNVRLVRVSPLKPNTGSSPNGSQCSSPSRIAHISNPPSPSSTKVAASKEDGSESLSPSPTTVPSSPLSSSSINPAESLMKSNTVLLKAVGSHFETTRSHSQLNGNDSNSCETELLDSALHRTSGGSVVLENGTNHSLNMEDNLMEQGEPLTTTLHRSTKALPNVINGQSEGTTTPKRQSGARARKGMEQYPTY